MNTQPPIHPLDRLSADQKCQIYYRRVVDLALATGLLEPDPNSPVGHFVFSSHYFHGKTLDEAIGGAVARFRRDYPKLAAERYARLNNRLAGAIESFWESTPQELIRELILIGATFGVWPRCTSFVLTYPWDLGGTPRPVGFRSDLSDFMKRRVTKILLEAGKLKGPGPFHSA